METLFIGKNLLFLHEVESTNTYAMNLLRNVNAIEGTVVYTDNQTHGKGQRGANWGSEIAQNITASIIIKPHFLNIDNAFYLSKISALAVYDVLTELLPNSHNGIKIKWPNDILVNQQKISGILIENNFTNATIQNSIIGIGLNVNQLEFSNFDRIPTSLKILSNKDYDRNQILEMLCVHLEKWYLKLKELKLNLIDEIYLNRLYKLNEYTGFVDSTGINFTAKIINVSNRGKLIVEVNDGFLKEFDVKEIKFLQ